MKAAQKICSNEIKLHSAASVTAQCELLVVLYSNPLPWQLSPHTVHSASPSRF